MNAVKITAPIILLWLSTVAQGQEIKDIFNAKNNMTWLGLDFSGAKFIGDRERLGTQDDQHKLITAWNALMLKEPQKFDVGKALRRSALPEAISITMEHNNALDLTGRVEDLKGLVHLTKEDVAGIVSSYDFKTLQGIGIMFVVESFSKEDNKALIWVTFINLQTKEIIFTDRFTEPPGGFGMRNYWAGSVYKLLGDLKSKYDTWKKKYQ